MTIRLSEEEYKKLQARPEKGKLAPIGRPDPLAGVRAPSKYRNRKTGGYASAREAKRAAELKLLLASGAITDLQEQVPFVLIPAQYDANRKLLERQCMYVCDFQYVRNGQKVVEDCKGIRTPDYIIKRKLMLHVHGIAISET